MEAEESAAADGGSLEQLLPAEPAAAATSGDAVAPMDVEAGVGVMLAQ